MTKYKEYFLKMLEENNEVFTEFEKLHNLYSSDEDKYQDQYNKEGAKVLDLVREYENKLCRQTEKGMYNVFSPKLSEKFQEEVKKKFPLFDHIGLKVEYTSPVNNATNEEPFIIKKIL
jgi:hypothetical protein